MTDQQLKTLSLWFDSYTQKCTSTDRHVLAAIKLKIRHTLLVCANINLIANSLALSKADENLAIICGLLHDIGRFEQVINFSTFNDAISCDHALLGVKVIKNQNVLFELDDDEQQIIYTCIQWHNKKVLSDDLDNRHLLFTKILRDADKLDIMRIFMEYYQVCAQNPNPILEFNLPQEGECSKEIIEQILLGKQADAHSAKNVIDLRLSKLSWVYDLNFVKSKEVFLQRQFIEKTMQVIQKSKDTLLIEDKLKKYLQNTN